MSNIDAFLQMIAVSEGTAQIPNSDGGYRVIVGSTADKPILFDSYADHPRKLIRIGSNLSSTAAGKFQILERYFDAYKATLKLPDFSPASQDAIAIQMIRERSAFADACAGHIPDAVAKCSAIWASLAGSQYGQPTHTIEYLTQAFVASGGQTA